MPDVARLSVSVVTPSFNQGRFIARTLQSVAGQSRAALEHIVFDGGSGDETLEVLRNFEPRVRWTCEADRGQAHAVNKAIAASSGDIVAWINSDDVYASDALERAARYLEEHPEVDVVYGDAEHIDADDGHIDAYPTEPFDLKRLQEFCFICQPAAFFRRRCVAAHGMLDERLHYCMDYEYWLRLARAGARFAYLPGRMAGSRLHGEAKTLRARRVVHHEINDMLRRTLGRVPDRWLLGYGSVVVAQRIDPRRQPWRFSIASGLAALGASLRWNRRISPGVGRALLGGLCDALAGRFHGAAGK